VTSSPPSAFVGLTVSDSPARSMRWTVRVVIAPHLPSTCTTTAHVIPHHGREKTRRAAGLTAAWTLVHPAVCRPRITREHVGTLSGDEWLAPCRRTALGSVVSRAAYSDAASNQSSSACPSLAGACDRSRGPVQPAPIAGIHNHYRKAAGFRTVPYCTARHLTRSA
jgi:hypothetical protein